MPLTFQLAEMFGCAGRLLHPLPGQEGDTAGSQKTDWVEGEDAESGVVLCLRVNVDEHPLPLADGALWCPCLPFTPNG